MGGNSQKPSKIADAQTASQTFAQVQLITITEEDAGQRIDNFLLRICKGVPKSHV